MQTVEPVGANIPHIIRARTNDWRDYGCDLIHINTSSVVAPNNKPMVIDLLSGADSARHL